MHANLSLVSGSVEVRDREKMILAGAGVVMVSRCDPPAHSECDATMVGAGWVGVSVNQQRTSQAVQHGPE